MPCGYRAIESLRLEMGYRVWSTDITPETTPYEAGLGFCVKLDKPGGFVGDDALREAKAAGLTRKLSLLVLDDPRAVVLGAEPVRVGSEVVGRVTSGGFGYTCERSLAYAYLPIDLAKPGTEATINLFGEHVAATVTDVRTLLPHCQLARMRLPPPDRTPANPRFGGVRRPIRGLPGVRCVGEQAARGSGQW